MLHLFPTQMLASVSTEGQQFTSLSCFSKQRCRSALKTLICKGACTGWQSLPAAPSVSVEFGMVLEKWQGKRPELFWTARITAGAERAKCSKVCSNAFDIKMLIKKKQVWPRNREVTVRSVKWITWNQKTWERNIDNDFFFKLPSFYFLCYCLSA